MCIEQDKKSGVWRLERTELDRLVAGMVKGRVEGLEAVLHVENLNVRKLLTELKTLSGSPAHAKMETPCV
jgi:hypothetical protein